MSNHRVTTTPRLELRAVTPSDLDGLFPIMHDPAQWAHAPHARHLDRRREPPRALQPQGTRHDPSDGIERLAFTDRLLTPEYYAQA